MFVHLPGEIFARNNGLGNLSTNYNYRAFVIVLYLTASEILKRGVSKKIVLASDLVPVPYKTLKIKMPKFIQEIDKVPYLSSNKSRRINNF